MKNENFYTCENCGREVLKMSQLMHSNHCPNSRQNTQHQHQQPLRNSSDSNANLITNEDLHGDDIQFKECSKCNSYFPENEYEDHMLCHKLEEENLSEMNQQQQVRQHHQPHNQHRNHQLEQHERHSHVHQARNPNHHHPQSSQYRQPSIQRFIRTSADQYGNRIQEKEDHYSDGRVVITKEVFDPYGNLVSSYRSSGSSCSDNNLFHIPGISIFNPGNNARRFIFTTNSPHIHPPRPMFYPSNPQIPPHHAHSYIPLLSFDEFVRQMLSMPTTNPVSKELINELPQSVVNDVSKLSAEKKNCVICFTDFENGDKTIVLPCIHLFHYDCIVEWFGSHNTCPVCKYEITENSH